MSEQEFASESQIVEHFSKLQQEYNNIAGTVAKLELEIRDHSSVLTALRELDGDRKCYRLIGGVLAERTVKEVVPAVESNMENLENTVKKLHQDLDDKEMELSAFKTKYKIRFKNESINTEERSSSSKTRGSSGVLA
ncbi:hypothetical protein C9374_004895 [Naegleria lovaniensis]|uniref:Prefoldin subunit 2 n=1 Tax=Naegleria lovaniensis TaxID=51637 RepID=A0AA88GR00_NAELO|nr:uncharacterized protein C9374_004895 [Naegleria lovaniensis]KAG2382928.1 hypothetical protein C9374_004895 [Naegleria lovaniensis]